MSSLTTRQHRKACKAFLRFLEGCVADVEAFLRQAVRGDYLALQYGMGLRIHDAEKGAKQLNWIVAAYNLFNGEVLCVEKVTHYRGDRPITQVRTQRFATETSLVEYLLTWKIRYLNSGGPAHNALSYCELRAPATA